VHYVYTFRQAFVHDQKPDARFCKLMRRLSGKNGWFAPVSRILDYLREQRPCDHPSGTERARMEMAPSEAVLGALHESPKRA